MGTRCIRLCALLTLTLSTSLWALASTNGSPLGGIGTGYVKFNAKTGQMAAVVKIMPAASVAANEFNTHQSSSCGLHFFVKGSTTAFKLKNTTNDENGVLPVYSAVFPAIGGVTFADTSFGPLVSGVAHDQLVHSPLAYFDVTAKNTNNFPCTVAVALEFSNQTSGGANLLGGTNSGTSDGNNAVTWGGDNNAGYAYMMAGCDNQAATFSSGAIGSFTANGTLAQGAGNIVSARCGIAAGQTAHFRFVMSWWNRWILTPPSQAKPGPEDHWYHNYYANAKECAIYGMNSYERVRSGAISIVKRTMASNFPEWYKDRLLNNLYPVIHNSVVAKDGRTAYWEGVYGIIGTIDQIEHGAVWYAFNWPQNQWRELQFWARSSHKAAEGALLGQVHHDVNGPIGLKFGYQNSDANHFMYPWDNSTHDDYSFQKNTTNWMDLNCMFIFKAYELMLATGNKDSFKLYWPYVKNTANRIIVFSGNDIIPKKSLSTYDSPSAQNWVYPSAVSLTAWLAVVEMAKWMEDAEAEKKFSDHYARARGEFATTYAGKPDFGNGPNANHPEGDIGGYSFARYFGLSATIDSQYIVNGCNNLWKNYNGLSGSARLGLWHFYQYDHLGGALTAINQPDKALDVHKWDYDHFYTSSPGNVYWQHINSSNNKSYGSYGTAPTVWRSLSQFAGTLLDNANNRLWIRPIIPTSMAGTITNSPIINPRGWGTLNYSEVAVGTRVQNIFVTFDSVIPCRQIVLKNNTRTLAAGSNLAASIGISSNGIPLTGFAAVTEGSGFEKNIRITFANPVQLGPQGMIIQVFNGAVSANGIGAKNRRYLPELRQGFLAAGKTFCYTVDVPGSVSLEIFGINGVKIGSIMQGVRAAGAQTLVWGGRTTEGKVVRSGAAVMRLSTPAGAVYRNVVIRK